jgi:hypothetical protein
VLLAELDTVDDFGRFSRGEPTGEEAGGELTVPDGFLIGIGPCSSE